MEAVADVCQQLFGIAPGAMLLVCLLVFLAGYVDAIAGGGGLISLPAYMIAGLPTHAAIATNKMSSTMGTTIATWHYAKSGYIQWKLAGVCVVLAVAGSTIGSNLVLITSDAFLSRCKKPLSSSTVSMPDSIGAPSNACSPKPSPPAAPVPGTAARLRWSRTAAHS